MYCKLMLSLICRIIKLSSHDIEKDMRQSSSRIYKSDVSMKYGLKLLDKVVEL